MVRFPVPPSQSVPLHHLTAARRRAEHNPKSVGSVILKGEAPVQCTMLILGVGVGPATEFLANSGFELEKDKGIKVDEFMRVPGYDGKIFAVSEDGAGWSGTRRLNDSASARSETSLTTLSSPARSHEGSSTGTLRVTRWAH
jgi:hypothetical protein